MVRTSTKAMPFFLVYGCEAVLSLKIQITSLRIVLMTEMMNEENYLLWLKELKALDDKRL